jgi:hypothetical protein
MWCPGQFCCPFLGHSPNASANFRRDDSSVFFHCLRRDSFSAEASVG